MIYLLFLTKNNFFVLPAEGFFQKERCNQLSVEVCTLVSVLRYWRVSNGRYLVSYVQYWKVVVF